MFRKKYPEHVKDWFTYGDLEGFRDEEIGGDRINEGEEGGDGSAVE